MMRETLSVGALALVVLSVPTHMEAQDTDWSAVEIQATEVADGVYMLTGQGGNLGLSIGDDGAFLVDDQFAPLTEKIQAAITALTSEPVRFVLNTHWHGDHTGGNENMGEAGALIVAHDNVRKRLNPAEVVDLIGRSQQAPPAALPVITFAEQVTFHWNGDDIRVFHVGHAHTDGDAIVVFTRANVVHMGDTFFNGRFPFIDMDSGGGIDGAVAAADAVLDLATAETRIIPGHGDLAGPDELRAYRDMLTTVRDRVQERMTGGMTEDEVAQSGPTSDLTGTFTGNAERFVRAVYQSLAGR